MLALAACSGNVSVTKTADGYYPPTNPSLIQILKTVPDRKYLELGTVTASGFDIGVVAKMHNALRSQAADLGATAVILTDEGIIPKPFGHDRWGTGVAIRYTDG